MAVRLARRGARVHPRARLDGPMARIHLGRGATVSERCVLAAVGDGEISLGTGVWLAHDCELETDGLIEVGNGTSLQRRTSLNGNVVIGDRCIVAPNVFVSSGTHLPGEDGTLPDRPVLIGDDCWLGVNAVVMPGVVVGSGAVVGANAVVTHDVAPGTIVAGVPARPISAARTLPR